MKKENNTYSTIVDSLNESMKEKISSLIEKSAERSLLSILLTNHHKFPEIISTFNLDHFGNPVCKKIFEIVLWISKNRNKGNFVTPEQIIYEDNFRKDIIEIRGDKFIKALKDNPYNSNSYEIIKNIILASKLKRDRYCELCISLGRLLDYDGQDIQEIISIGMDEQLNTIDKIKDKNNKLISHMSDGLIELIQERIDCPQDVIGPPLKSFPILNEFIQFKPGNLIVFAARQKIGKSTFQLNLAKDICIDQKIPGGIVDSEMLTWEQQIRLTSSISSVEVDKIEKGLIAKNEGDMKRVEDAVKKIIDSPLYTKRVPIFDTSTILSNIKLMHIMNGVKIAFFDQIKDTIDKNSLNSEKENQRVVWLAFSLKNLAEELNIPIVANIQFKRGASAKNIASGEVEPDELIADSDKVGRFANSCCFIRDKTEDEIRRDSGILKGGNRIINVFLNRGGQTHHQQGGINYLLRGQFSRFEELEVIENF